MTSRMKLGAILLALLMLPSVTSRAASDTVVGQSAAQAPVAAKATQLKRASAGSASPVADAMYAQREADAPGLESFAGGSRGVYIGGSTVVVVLLIVLIILII